MRTSQHPLSHPDAPQQHDLTSTPRAAGQHQRRRYVYAQRTPPTVARRMKTQLIGRAGQRVPGDANDGRPAAFAAHVPHSAPGAHRRLR